MRVDSAVVGMTGDQNISEKEKKKIKKMCRQKKKSIFTNIQQKNVTNNKL